MILFFALLLDWFVGDPDRLWRRIPHPVALIGMAIDFIDQRLNRPGLTDEDIRRHGIATIVIVVVLSLSTGAAIAQILSGFGPVSWLMEIALVSVFLAQKSLKDHVNDVAVALRQKGVKAGRTAVAKIVGRDPEKLDKSGVSRAAIESLAENFSDGIVAPALWYVLLGLPGLIAYKAINTADSMIAHKNERYLQFGRATALVDDLVNWPAARLSALLIAIASSIGGGLRHGVAIMDRVTRDAGSHRSPNAGWPETAMAAALDIALGGLRNYSNQTVRETRLNMAGRPDLDAGDIDRALVVFHRSCFSLWVLVFLIS